MDINRGGAREKLRGVRHFRSYGLCLSLYGDILEVIASFQNFVGTPARAGVYVVLAYSFIN